MTCLLNDFCDSLGFKNLINKSTRLNPISMASTLLDVILVLSFRFFLNSHVIHFAISDHSLCISIFNHSSIKNSPRALTSLFLSKKRLNELRLLFKKYLWYIYNSLTNPDDRWLAINEFITSMLDQVSLKLLSTCESLVTALYQVP